MFPLYGAILKHFSTDDFALAANAKQKVDEPRERRIETSIFNADVRSI